MLNLKKHLVLIVSVSFFLQTGSVNAFEVESIDSKINKSRFMQQSKLAAKQYYQHTKLIETESDPAPMSLAVDTHTNCDTAESVPDEYSSSDSNIYDTSSAEGAVTYESNIDKILSALKEITLQVNETTVSYKRLAEQRDRQRLSNMSSLSSVEEALLDTDRVDPWYKGHSVTLSPEDYEKVERLVMGEAGNQGVIGAALVAQCIRDLMDKDGTTDIDTIRKSHGFTGKMTKAPCADVKEAVDFIFNRGGIAVQHEVYYFYAPAVVYSAFHESQKFVVEYKGHRFFSTW